MASAPNYTQPPPAPSVRPRNPPTVDRRKEVNPPTAGASSVDTPSVTPNLYTEPPTGTERCLVFAGAEISGRKSHKVYAVRLDHDLQVISLGKFNAKESIGFTSCCVHNQTLYLSGMGDSGDEVLGFDLQTKTTACVARLHGVSVGNAMTTLPNGHLCVLGGCAATSVEVVDPSSNTSTVAGHLKERGGFSMACCHIGDKILVCGNKLRPYLHHVIQVWDITTSSSIDRVSICNTNDRHLAIVYGAVHVQDYVVVVCGCYTLVYSMKEEPYHMKEESTSFLWSTLLWFKDSIWGNAKTSHRVNISDKYLSPNDMPAVVLSSDEQTLMLLGGEARGNPEPQYVYQASVHDVVHNTGPGWIPVDMSWPLGDCKMVGGYDVADILQPLQACSQTGAREVSQTHRQWKKRSNKKKKRSSWK